MLFYISKFSTVKVTFIVKCIFLFQSTQEEDHLSFATRIVVSTAQSLRSASWGLPLSGGIWSRAPFLAGWVYLAESPMSCLPVMWLVSKRQALSLRWFAQAQLYLFEGIKKKKKKDAARWGIRALEETQLQKWVEHTVDPGAPDSWIWIPSKSLSTKWEQRLW